MKTSLICAGLIAVIVACGSPQSAHAADRVYVTTSDYTTGSLSTIAIDNWSATNNVANLHSDAVVRFFEDRIYVVNRFGGDNIQVIDPANYSTDIQFSVGAGSDPHDIVVLSPTRAYVTRYNETGLWIVNPLTGAHTGTIDFSWLADADGLPEMDYMVQVGDRVFVTVQRIDRDNYYTPVGDSYVAVIDATTDQIVDVDPVAAGTQAIALGHANPFSEIQIDPWGGRLYVSCVGFFGLADGAVETIDPYAMQGSGAVISEATAGGDINDIEMVSADKAYAIVADANFDTKLIALNMGSGTVSGTLFAPGGYVLQDIELAPLGPFCLLADRTVVNPGIRVFDTLTDAQLTSGPIDVGLPPYDIAFNLPVQTGVDHQTPPVAYLGAGYPNPLGSSSVTIPFTLERATDVRLAVYDVTGRRVRVLVERTVAAGEHRQTWDGRDDTRSPVPSGVYFVRLDAGGRRDTRKLVVVR